MKNEFELKSSVREVLKGKWTKAVLIGLVASILGATGSNGPEVKLTIEEKSARLDFGFAGQNIYSTGGGLDSDIGAFLAGSAVYIIVAAAMLGIVYFILASVVEIGYGKVNLNLMKCKEPSFDTLFDYLPYWKTAAAARFLRGLYILLWSLLLILPGIMASFSYKMTPYILADNPDLTASEAISRSKLMMEGHRMSLFLLWLSFIHLELVCLLTFGIGRLWLVPYKQAAYAAFYKEIIGPQYEYWEQL